MRFIESILSILRSLFTTCSIVIDDKIDILIMQTLWYGSASNPERKLG